MKLLTHQPHDLTKILLSDFGDQRSRIQLAKKGYTQLNTEILSLLKQNQESGVLNLGIKRWEIKEKSNISLYYIDKDKYLKLLKLRCLVQLFYYFS